MGFPMAGNIRRKMSPSHTLFVHDIHNPSCERFATEFGEHGPIKIVQSAKEAADAADVVVSIVPSANDVRKIYLDPLQGVIAAGKNINRLLVECSTIDSNTAKEVGKALKAAEAGTYIDAPVSVRRP